MSQVLQQGSRGALNFEQVTVDATAGGVKLTVNQFSQQFNATSGVRNPGASGALITVEGADIRVMFDPATVVTSSVGHLVTNGSSITVDGTENLRNLRFIRAAGVNATISVTYWA